MYNYFRQGWVVGRLVKMVETAFDGESPIVISLPYREKITPDQNQGGATTMLIVGKTEAATAAIRSKLEESKAFWIHLTPDNNQAINGYSASPPQMEGTQRDHWWRITPSVVETRGIGPLPSDDWPFLYLRTNLIPWLNLWGILIVAALSLAILVRFAPPATTRPNGRMFFLGAGFMLLETKGVVQLALLFGSTWIVNSIVFFAILVMVLLSNLYVVMARPRRLGPYYALLVASLVIGAFLPMDAFLEMPAVAKVVLSCAVTFVPIFFAGVVFATEFRESQQPDVDFGSNIGGVILGGLSENVSLIVGFRHLLLLAVVYYLLSALFSRRVRSPIP